MPQKWTHIVLIKQVNQICHTQQVLGMVLKSLFSSQIKETTIIIILPYSGLNIFFYNIALKPNNIYIRWIISEIVNNNLKVKNLF